MQFVFGRHAKFRSPHVLTIGNFDGVHVGHQRVIHQAQQVAQQLQLPLTVLLFEPQPKEYFADHIAQAAPARLMNLKSKVMQLLNYELKIKVKLIKVYLFPVMSFYMKYLKLKKILIKKF